MFACTHWRQEAGKANTRKIERKNLNFRTHIKRLQRKTICFSKNEQIHDNVIGLHIETYYFKHEVFLYPIKYQAVVPTAKINTLPGYYTIGF
ncbi:hypothetical protein BVG80_17860 [Sphingobacteriales bacterium TSM_CSM]|nr:hypothetical protein BVG80_17860 [Sphingobacteriales bacterium TSM_CSM]